MGMREDFEEYCGRRGLACVRDDGESYEDVRTAEHWYCWQQSRKSVEINLPQHPDADPAWNQALRYVIYILKAAGLKVKP